MINTIKIIDFIWKHDIMRRCYDSKEGDEMAKYEDLDDRDYYRKDLDLSTLNTFLKETTMLDPKDEEPRGINPQSMHPNLRKIYQKPQTRRFLTTVGANTAKNFKKPLKQETELSQND